MLTEDEQARARHHLGYMQVQSAFAFVLGVPASVQTAFMIESAFSKVLPSGEPKLRQLLDILDGIETQVISDQETLVVESLDSIKIRPDEFNQLLKQYQWWQRALANILGVPPNPFDQRFTSGGGLNVTVSG